jgi:hypothetical protein
MTKCCSADASWVANCQLHTSVVIWQSRSNSHSCDWNITMLNSEGSFFVRRNKVILWTPFEAVIISQRASIGSIRAPEVR